jgi:uncharacterized protein (DUF1800 family)
MLSFARALTRAPRRWSACVALLLAVAGCVSVQSRSEPSTPAVQPLSQTERIAHVLSRLTFGARPGDAERVAAMGIDRWIDQQLRPESIADSVVLVALAPIPAWSQPATNIGLNTAAPRLASMTMSSLLKDSTALAALKQLQVRLVSLNSLNDVFFAGKIIRAQVSERQLYEVVSDFWENHFSVWVGKMPSREALPVLNRDAVRPRALGKFRDLLGAVAHSPAMLFYLDNQLSTSRGLNENYARELLELHTLGVDGGYTQHDVIDVARALTGWAISTSSGPATFVFRRELHDTGSKIVLGHTLTAGRGIEDGEEVLDIIARHPPTARHIAFKLARRLVSDEPPPALVDRAAATFLRTDGDIAEVVRTIVTSPEFFSRAAFRAKVKTPFELVISVRRALDLPPDTTPTTARLIAQLGQPTFGWQAPDGWPEKGVAWMNSAAIYKRIRFAGDVANASPAFMPLDRWRDWATLSMLPLDRQVDGVVTDILGGCAEPATREAMRAIRPGEAVDSTAGDGQRRLRDLLGIAFASPEFQRR